MVRQLGQLLLITGSFLCCASAFGLPEHGSTNLQTSAAGLISVDVKDTPVSSIFQTIGSAGKYNVVLDPDVSGTISLTVHDVPWQQLLENVLRIRGLSKKIEGNVLYIFPVEKTAQYW